ncbi:hypothetical protein P154DRAFT_123595 [Amniculicola lignicola CBS 123094]|uniref:Uncharacterized protein n=1 Tax=Amniculicola lignicola CBS 123094 TaxID=1392246 RepID=A0A6A5WPI6_9PLEO|nr:hypothetical protein P154DRAFT_123595 [Amniculicola lignicola CBS 123094]
MALHGRLESLPPELVSRILSFLVHPRSRLPGRTERLSSYECPRSEKRAAQVAYHDDFTAPPDTDRWVADMFSIIKVQHPLNELALTSRRMRDHVERFCSHLVRSNNVFNLPFSLLDLNGPRSVYPDMSSIVYRRLWLQFAPRCCIYCSRTVSVYPRHNHFGPLTGCGACFLAQVFEWREVKDFFHLTEQDMLQNGVSGTPNFQWVLRSDVEKLALSRWGVKRFHMTSDNEPYEIGEWCRICGLTVEEVKDEKSSRRTRRRQL